MQLKPNPLLRLALFLAGIALAVWWFAEDGTAPPGPAGENSAAPGPPPETVVPTTSEMRAERRAPSRPGSDRAEDRAGRFEDRRPEPTTPHPPLPPGALAPPAVPPSDPQSDAGTALSAGDGGGQPAPRQPRMDSEALANEIRSEFRAARAGIMRCYEEILRDRPDRSDRIVFELRVTPDPADPALGLTELVSIESVELQPAELECFANLIDDFRLPSTTDASDVPGPYTLRYPVQLSAE